MNAKAAKAKSEDIKAISIRVLDKEYQVACPADEEPALLESARLLDEKMREIRDTRKMIGADRIAVMAALNLAHDLIQAQTDSAGGPSFESKLRSLQSKVEAAITRGRQLEL
ncbi:MAG TPA: cell division protein ZapA [Gammaproteobacteria bacterium]|nr:cell division protein ZapA [Gammaproteobacteria bacterium]